MCVTAGYELNLGTQFGLILVFSVALLWFRRLVAGFSPRWPGFGPRPVRVRLMVGKVTLTGFSPSSSVSLVSVVPPMLDTHLHLHVASYRVDRWAKARNSCVRLNVCGLHGKLEDRIFSAEWYRPFRAISLVRSWFGSVVPKYFTFATFTKDLVVAVLCCHQPLYTQLLSSRGGSVFAPNYACPFVGRAATLILTHTHSSLPSDCCQCLPILWSQRSVTQQVARTRRHWPYFVPSNCLHCA